MKRCVVGIVIVGALALAGCGSTSDEVVELGVPAQSVVTTSTTFKDSVVCVQDAESPLPWGDESMREPPCPSPSTATVPEAVVDRTQMRAAQSDLRNALTAQKTYYTDTQEYTADVNALGEIEPSLDWGGKVKVVVGSTDEGAGRNSMVCMSTTAQSGETLSIADYAPEAVWFGTSECPDEITLETLRAMRTSW
jgi:hypothetical protein